MPRRSCVSQPPGTRISSSIAGSGCGPAAAARAGTRATCTSTSRRARTRTTSTSTTSPHARPPGSPKWSWTWSAGSCCGPGSSGHGFAAADVADVAISVSRRDAQFRQLGEDPSYVVDNAASVAGTIRLDRFLPDRWGIAAPLTVRYAATSSDPFYLAGTDLRGDALDGLRTPQSRAASYSLSLRRTRQPRSGLLRTLLDPAALSASYTDGTTRSDLASATASSYALGLDYNLTPGAARWGPLRLNPANIRFRTGVAGSEGSRFTYLVPVARAADTLAAPARSRTKLWRSAGGLDLLPLGGVQLRVDVASQRDLRDYGDSTTIGRLVRHEPRTFLGRDVGIETQRSITTLLNLMPQLAAWVRPRATLATGFFLSRDPNARDPVRDVGDTAGGMPP